MEILIGFCLGLLFNYSALKIRQAKLDAKVFEAGVSQGIRAAKMAHTQIVRHPHRDGISTNLYCHAEFSYPEIKK
jgi:hypothetical protein